MSQLIDRAKLFERRRCGHRPDEYPEPLSELECIKSVVDPKDSKHNKNRYVVASQDINIRKAMRAVLGTPLIYINRSVMIMEPMAGATAGARDIEERKKFRSGLQRGSEPQDLKRKRDEGGDGGISSTEAMEPHAKKMNGLGKGPKGPNPLAVKKPKKRAEEMDAKAPSRKEKLIASDDPRAEDGDESSIVGVKRKRRRKHKSGVGEAAGTLGESKETVGNESD